MYKMHNNHQKSSIIHINQKLSTSMKDFSTNGEYSLKKSLFDPSKSSPPNNFMLKLKIRMTLYNENNYVDKIVDSLDKE